MKTASIGLIALAALGGCAQTMNLTGSPAEQQCSALARGDDMRVNEVQGTDDAAGAQNVRMRLEDAVGRRFNATCIYTAANGARWQSPLPANAARR